MAGTRKTGDGRGPLVHPHELEREVRYFRAAEEAVHTQSCWRCPQHGHCKIKDTQPLDEYARLQKTQRITAGIERVNMGWQGEGKHHSRDERCEEGQEASQ